MSKHVFYIRVVCLVKATMNRTSIYCEYYDQCVLFYVKGEDSC